MISPHMPSIFHPKAYLSQTEKRNECSGICFWSIDKSNAMMLRLKHYRKSGNFRPIRYYPFSSEVGPCENGALRAWYVGFLRNLKKGE
ncbi:Uncharacterized protein HZ326_28716 [Fusarium oxysporum f. sp. albedinis]|nr:Uncharacterized protein HZ326_28716 [Fusarium oxysporum f. sp. albedinis]